MLAAISEPPHLVSIFPFVTSSEYYEGWTYQSGALMQWFAGTWSSGLARDTLRRQVVGASRSRDWMLRMPIDEYPILEVPSMDETAPYFDDWIEHETDDAYWQRWKISDHCGELSIKALHGGGWHDIFLKGSIGNYIGMKQSAETADARASQRLLLGPWAHAETSPEGKVGDVVFGKQASPNMTQTILDWSDYALKDVANEFATGAPVRIFVMGDNVWRDEQEFPLARAVATSYRLRSSSGANSIRGDGRLDLEAPGSEKPDSFVYDPGNPVPTIGGRLCCGNAVIAPGPFDQRPNEGREDVLVYSTPPLEKDVEVTGFIILVLYASTTAADTDFTAMLVDVEPTGYARFLTDGIVRARYRESTKKAVPIVPGEIVRYEIDLWATSNVFKAGHRIRVYVSSSNFPRFNRNPNTGARNMDAEGMVKATQTIYHDAAHPSALVLPVVPR
jgi:putative CocE/NonD family hydrolase